MANITKYLRNRLIQQSLGKSPDPIWNDSTYVGLFVSSPTANWTKENNGSAVEVAGLGYERKQLEWTTDSLDPLGWSINESTGVISNDIEIVWSAQGYWAGQSDAISSIPIVAMGIFDSDSTSEANLLWFGPLSAAVTMGIDDTFSISPGSLIISLA
jgi:hypothetical protein